jgi:pyruvate kinase
MTVGSGAAAAAFREHENVRHVLTESGTDIHSLIDALMEVRKGCLAVEESFAGDLALVPPERRASARNLLNYMGLRQHDLRDLQRSLAAIGLSSLGRNEAWTLASLDAVLAALRQMAGQKFGQDAAPEPVSAPADFVSGPATLLDHTLELFGPQPEGRSTYIMVTMPSEASANYELVRDLLAAGMNIMRVNCAHDDAASWAKMIANLRHAENELSRSCRVLMDLAGPKLRTGRIGDGDCLVKWRPKRDNRGTVISPARVWLHSEDTAASPPGSADAVLPIENDLIEKIKAGDQLTFRDTRDRRRVLLVRESTTEGWWAECEGSATIEEGTDLLLRRDGNKVKKGSVGELPLDSPAIVLRVGDTLRLTDENVPGHSAKLDQDGAVKEPASIPVTLPQIFRDADVGQSILFDDGRIGGVIRKVDDASLEVEIMQALASGSKLRSDKGVNFPDTVLDVPSLTEKDLADLDFASKNADMVGLSFVRKPVDVLLLDQELAKRDARHVGIVLKIETRPGFENLAPLLLTGMQSPPLGVMVARGDLGVELGFERLSEVQEEILWFCEAAHVPVIWATEVLANLAKTGVPSRAEVTDAAMAGRAECVMLNKGPHITDAVRFLSGVLQRMADHQDKKRSMLRRLSISAPGPQESGETQGQRNTQVNPGDFL